MRVYYSYMIVITLCAVLGYGFIFNGSIIQVWTYDQGNMVFYGSEATILTEVNIVAEDP